MYGGKHSHQTGVKHRRLVPQVVCWGTVRQAETMKTSGSTLEMRQTSLELTCALQRVHGCRVPNSSTTNIVSIISTFTIARPINRAAPHLIFPLDARFFFQLYHPPSQHLRACLGVEEREITRRGLKGKGGCFSCGLRGPETLGTTEGVALASKTKTFAHLALEARKHH